TTRSTSGSTRSPSRPRRSSRRCAEKRKVRSLATVRRAFRRSHIRRPSRSNLHQKTMLRLPRLIYLRPRTAREAASMAAELGPRAMFVAGGTDLYPKLKRRQFEIEALIGLDFLDRRVDGGTDECVIDAGVTLAHASHDPHLNERFSGYAEAAGHGSSPP